MYNFVFGSGITEVNIAGNSSEKGNSKHDKRSKPGGLFSIWQNRYEIIDSINYLYEKQLTFQEKILFNLEIRSDQ